ncbi:MAG: radical SAM protein [Bacteroidetes bacterium GWF2_42_66]|nr:MAG: radical SAM protein [Bacteroidetes bacterium GWA2_42_15]OFX98081.1 MAG: radical SAM protein [Bacteroidetes bacterium GWE2_42_39]OFY42464.1 MAG: radical SAM protein [Bacteroidetes bacterium GWF2_42_66]HBL74175.1 radical SAM protein [Prolixibacteraceae bacterium]HCR91661.1 radical SAM protein [Prolixibacteraceae bacterium]
MYDRFNRHINYLRISVTDRCNLRCTYCMPEEGIPLMQHDDILSFEEITQFTRLAVSKGITKVRLTGGEPLVRKGITELVSMLASIEGIEDLSMTTNGILLEQFAGELKKSGLRRVNISMDTVDDDRYCEITRNGDLGKVFAGIKAAQKAGLGPIKINCVLLGQPDEDTQKLKDFCRENKLSLRFIHQMNLKNGEFSKVEGGEGGNCSRCNRVRLLANGDVKPCLFSDLAFNIRELGHEKALQLAIGEKPQTGTFNQSGQFYNIGG